MTQLWRAPEPLWQWNATSSWLLAVLLLFLSFRVFAAFLRRWWKVENHMEVHERRLDKMDKKLDSVIEGLASLRNDMNRFFLEMGPKATVRGRGLPAITSGKPTTTPKNAAP